MLQHILLTPIHLFFCRQDEYLIYAQSNREEWEARGKEMVAELAAKLTETMRILSCLYPLAPLK
jgi:hypothetical protein